MNYIPLRFGSLCALLILLVSSITCQENYEEPCDSEIYCHGGLIHTIQLNHLYHDDKTYVDLPLKVPPNETLRDFNALNIFGDVHGDPQKIGILRDFISSHFSLEEAEFEPWIPSDWIPNPKFLGAIRNPNYRVWAEQLHGFWHELGRKIREDVASKPDHYSIQYVSHPVIIPGGRFKEFYYWDSYWIQKGLLVSEMEETVRGMILNFAEMVEDIGFIPNGGRVYYRRSQPPLFLPMVKNYLDATGNWSFVEENIHTLEKEFLFFMQNRTISVQKGGERFTMAIYNVELKGPRPESYSKDYELVKPLNLTIREENLLYANLKSGAESGWDFSSRWFENEEDGNLEDTKTMDIVPVDLNGFLYWNAVILNEFCHRLNCTESPHYYARIAQDWKDAIHKVLWDEESGSWFDYDYVKGNLRKHFYPSNLVPLWVHAQHSSTVPSKVVQYLKDCGALKDPGGIPTSLLQTGEQWDYPNGWPPVNHIVVEALEYSGDAEAKELAFDIASKWTTTNYVAYCNHNRTMFEKYDVSCIGCAGGGGEYEVVVGFGWTNGVILDFLHVYGDRLTAPRIDNSACPTVSFSERLSFSVVTLSVMAMVTLIFC